MYRLYASAKTTGCSRTTEPSHPDRQPSTIEAHGVGRNGLSAPDDQKQRRTWSPIEAPAGRKGYAEKLLPAGGDTALHVPESGRRHDLSGDDRGYRSSRRR
jgi:hypothetical protein